ncbi:MAG: mannitol dehydrogenase family protein [Treponema sp.]|nr:mannitol dehydrogenase family protein [Treponema sp.]
MTLSDKGLRDASAWQAGNYTLPRFDRARMIAATEKNPAWIHFGAGNIFRAFQATLAQKLLDDNLCSTGIIVGEGFDTEIIEKAYRPFDNLSLLVTLKADGTISKTVVASVASSLICKPTVKDDWNALTAVFRNKSLQMASFTITEKGYATRGADGAFLPIYKTDFEAGPDGATSFLAHLCALLHERYIHAEKQPLALVSMDNCSHNGEKLREAVATIVSEWEKRGFVEHDFVNYISSPNCISFPWTMIDKITPRPHPDVQKQLEQDGLESAQIIVTDKHTYTAPFVNAEEPQYLVVEDIFPNGRPPLEKAGVYFCDRETVNNVERMKVCTCLNPLHTTLAVFGCLLGHTLIADEMKDTELNALVKKIGYSEGLPVVTDPKIINPKKFIDEVINVRLPNQFMPDTPQRIACDTSQKLSIRFGETIKAYCADATLTVQDLTYIPLVFAGWCRYLMGIDDEGKQFAVSPDPLLEHVCKFVKPVALGGTYTEAQLDAFLHPLLADAFIFGVDLYKVHLAERVVQHFSKLIAGTGAVRKTLQKYVQ